MIRVGIVDCDTSHVVQFTMRLNHLEIDEEQWVEGAKVVAACHTSSDIAPEETCREYVEKLREFGVKIVEAPEDMIGEIDAVLIESQGGGVHLERARPFLEAGLSCFVDKPFACSVADAQSMADLAEKHGAPLFSSSSLRYALEVQECLADEAVGSIIGAHAYSPASLHSSNPGLFHYGIHGVETLYALMGAGCQEVWCTFADGAEVTTGLWSDGRIGTVRGTRQGAHAYGFTAWGEKGVRSSSINAAYIYRELLKRIVKMFETGQPPLDIEETIEIVRFIVAAQESAQNGGVRTALP